MGKGGCREALDEFEQEMSLTNEVSLPLPNSKMPLAWKFPICSLFMYTTQILNKELHSLSPHTPSSCEEIFHWRDIGGLEQKETKGHCTKCHWQKPNLRVYGQCGASNSAVDEFVFFQEAPPSKSLPVFLSRAVVTKYHRLGGLKNWNWVSPGSDAWRSKIRASVGGSGSFQGLWGAICSRPLP